MSTMNSGTSIQACSVAATDIDTSTEESDGEAYEEDDWELVVAVVSLVDGFRIQEVDTTQNRQEEAQRRVTVVVDEGHGAGFITWQAPREAFQEKKGLVNVISCVVPAMHSTHSYCLYSFNTVAHHRNNLAKDQANKIIGTTRFRKRGPH
jgi:hypothetical protein